MTALTPAVHLTLDEVRLLARGLAAQAIGAAVRPYTAQECSVLVWQAVQTGGNPRLGSLATMLAELEADLTQDGNLTQEGI